MEAFELLLLDETEIELFNEAEGDRTPFCETGTFDDDRLVEALLLLLLWLL